MHKEFEGLCFVLVTINDSHAKFVHSPLFGENVEQEVAIDNLKDWRPTKKELPAKCSEDQVKIFSPQNSSFFLEEARRFKVQHLLLQGYLENVGKCSTEGLCFVTPSSLWTSKSFAKGKIKLWPCGLVSKMKTNAKLTSKLAACVECEGVPYSITPFKALTDFTATLKEKEQHLLVPYFWVKVSKDDDSANLQTKVETYNGIKVPLLVNPEKVEAGVQLMVMDACEEVIEPKPKKIKRS